jgi:predicted O-methyltransferase YrrM
MALIGTPSTWLNIARFVAVKPSRATVLIKKVLKRLTGENDRGNPKNDAWIADNSISAEELAASLDEHLWKEARDFDTTLRARAETILKRVPYDLGGGSHHAFLYWLVRYKKPAIIAETGVAAGWSSAAFLAAIGKNEEGRLYSSDLPYFRLPDPEQFIGLLVPEELRRNWVLHVDSDEVNLPLIMSDVDHIDIFHYDSDKMASGRRYAVNLIRKKLAPRGLIIMDDIANDDWFRNYVTSEQLPYMVLDRRYGLIGDLLAR